MRVNICLLMAFCVLTQIACKDDDSNTDMQTAIENPETYDFKRDGASTVSFSGQAARIGMATELISALTDESVSSEALLEMFSNQSATGGDANPFEDAALNESTKSVKSKVAASEDYFSANTMKSAQIKADVQSWIELQLSETFASFNKLAKVGQAGQIADGSSVRFVSAKGLEYNQAVAKTLIGALMVDQICNNYLSTAVLDAGENRLDNDAALTEEGKSYTSMEHKWDEAYGYLFGASNDETQPLLTLGDDSFLNKYLSRVEDDSDFAGIASEIFEAFKLGRAAIVAGDYELRDEQADILKEKISQIVGVRAVYYLQNGKAALEAEDFGAAFHDLSEGFGFVYSLKFARDPASTTPLFSNEEVDGFIEDLTAGNGFWDVSSVTLDEISETIAAKFSFTVSEAAK